MTEDDHSFNIFLVVVFVLTVIMFLSIFMAQSAAG